MRPSLDHTLCDYQFKLVIHANLALGAKLLGLMHWKHLNIEHLYLISPNLVDLLTIDQQRKCTIISL